MTPHYADDDVTVHAGDCLDVLRELPDASIDAVCTDPPYSYAFMNRRWDAHPTPKHYQAWCEAWAVECLRVLKPGGHLLAFGGTRTYHRLACAVEDAGFELRDSIDWIYASGFPKSLNIALSIDRQAGQEGEWRREDHPTRAGARTNAGVILGQTDHTREDNPDGLRHVYEPGPAGAAWAGWGSALKPAHEPIVVARKPMPGRLTDNVLEYGVGALNVDGCRVEFAGDADRAESEGKNRHADFGSGARENHVYGAENRTRASQGNYDSSAGRWPSNVVLSHAPGCELVGQVDVATDTHYPAARGRGGISVPGHAGQDGLPERTPMRERIDAYDCAPGCPVAELGDVARFFPAFRYEPKAGTSERPTADGVVHPTVKPLELIRWLVRLVVPRGATVLDLFAGSGTTGEACIVEGMRAVLIEREATYLPLIVKRVSKPIATTLDLDVG